MDPTTTTIPPSSPSSPPPQNPHTPPNAIIDTDCFQEAEPSTTNPSNIENLKLLVLKLAGRMLPAHQSLIQQRFDDIFPDELLVPNHPPYADMILTALWELKVEGGSNEEAISDFIEKEYHELPWAHATILNYHLKDLCMKGKITMTQDRCYQRCSSIPKPIPTPNISPSPMSSAFSSSSDSLCSSPSSSSTSFCWGPPHQGHKSKRKRKRKNTVGRGGKRVQVRGRGRGRGRGRPPKTIQVGQRGRSLGMIQQRKQGSFCIEVKIGEESQTEEEQVDVDIVEEPKQATEVTSMEVEADSIQDGETGFSNEDHNKMIIGQKGRDEGNENVNEKGESRGVRRSGRRKYKTVSDEENLPCEEGTKEQGHKRKRYNVVWIGRRVQKMNENRTDLSEDQSDDELPELGECVDKEKEAVITGSDSNVVELLKKKEVKVATDVEHNQPIENHQSGLLEKQNDIGGELKVATDVEPNQPIENQQSDVLEKQNDIGGELKVTTDVEPNQRIENQHEQILEKQNDVGGEQKEAIDVEHNQPVENQQSDILEKQNDIGEELKVARDVEHNQPIENQHEDNLEKQNDICGEQKGATDVEHNQLVEKQQSDILEKQNDIGGELTTDVEYNQLVENQQSDILEKHNNLGGEQNDYKKKSKNETDKIIHFQGPRQRENMEQDQLQKQEIQTADVQDSVMIQCEAQAIVSDVGKQDDDKVKEQICAEEQPEKGSEQEESVQQQVQCVENREAESAKEQQTEVNQKEIVLTIDTEVQQNLEMNQKETQARQACVVENVSEEQSNASEKHVQPNEQCVERIQYSLRYCGQNWLENRENESAEEPPQQDEQQTEVNHKEIVLIIDTEVQQNLEKNHARWACAVQNASEEQPNVCNEHVQPQDHCTEGDKLQLHEQQKSDVMEKVQLEGEVKVAEDEHQQYQLNLVKEKDIGLVRSLEQVQLEGEVKAAEGECQQDQLNQLKEKGIGLVHGVSSDQRDSVMTQTESEVEGDNEEHENPETHQDQIGTQETVTSEVQPQLELQEGSEQRRTLRQGLRSSYKKEENQLERQTPVRRSLRHQKTVSEAAEVVEKESDHSEEKLKYSGRTRSSKREPKFSEAEQGSNLRKTRTGL